jgi:CheY-like chemotaxis protein
MKEPRFQSRIILVVEDDPNDEEMTLAALKKEHTVSDIVVVHDGAEALDYLYCRAAFAARPAGNPAVMLLDNKMPKVTGLEVLRQIKSDPHLKAIPVVMLTSSEEKSDLAECYQLGVNAYVVKPVRYNEFTKAVHDLGIFWGVVNHPPPAAMQTGA